MIEIDLDFIFFSVGIFFSLPIFWLLLAQKRQEPEGSEVVQVPTMIVLGSGGHTTEILRLSCSLREDVYRPRCYVIADSDATSEGRLRMSSIGKTRKPDPNNGHLNSGQIRKNAFLGLHSKAWQPKSPFTTHTSIYTDLHIVNPHDLNTAHAHCWDVLYQ